MLTLRPIERFRNARKLVQFSLVTTLCFFSRAAFADPAALMGSGNFNLSLTPATEAVQYSVLNAVGARSCRMNVFPYDYYWRSKQPTPDRLDSSMLLAHSFGVTPVLLFEYYSRFDTPVGDYNVWRSIGQAFAQRFRPNSPWWLSLGIKNFGVTLYTAFNEPDIDSPLLAPQVYHDALKGLADGVHSIAPELKVVPGGMAGPNSKRDFTSAGLGPAIADLLNDGSLDGIDIHIYNGRWAPLADHKSSAQYYFGAVKKAWGVTRDVNYYTTEFNYQQSTPENSSDKVTDSAAASYFLTVLWDNLGVAGNRGEPVTKLAFSWSLFNQQSSDNDYAMCTSLSPWAPNDRANVYSEVARLTSGMEIRHVDPDGAGTIILVGNGKTIWVWQDRPNWTTSPGSTYLLTGIPPGATKLDVYGWDGIRMSVPIHNQSTYQVTGLPGDETYMFVINKSAPFPAVAKVTVKID